MNTPLAFGDADHPCRFCGHPLGLHGLVLGCSLECTCMALPGEGRCRTEADFDKWLPDAPTEAARLEAYKRGSRRNHFDRDVDVLAILRGSSPIGPYDRERIAQEIERLRTERGED